MYSRDAKSSTTLEVESNFISFLQQNTFTTDIYLDTQKVMSVNSIVLWAIYLIVSAPDAELEESLKMSLGSPCWYMSINAVSLRRSYKMMEEKLSCILI